MPRCSTPPHALSATLPPALLLLLAILLGLLPAATAPARAAGLTVTSSGDSGPGTLRQAIIDANDSAGADTIGFDLPGAGPHTIALASPLPAISDPVSIDGLTQPGASCASWPPTLMVAISGAGSSGGGFADGMLTVNGTSATIRGLVLQGF